MDREKFFEWLNQYEGTYKFIEDEHGEVTIKFLVEEIENEHRR
tara:strand:- start:350 stop:478 length:129 start_codon:yes stop_codon:yes gene_type:complete